MKKPKITPGSWIANGRYVYAENQDTIAVVFVDKNNSKVEIADAKAISAVPEMIDALIDLVKSFEGGYEAKNTLDSIDQAEQALEKAGVEL